MLVLHLLQVSTGVWKAGVRNIWEPINPWQNSTKDEWVPACAGMTLRLTAAFHTPVVNCSYPTLSQQRINLRFAPTKSNKRIHRIANAPNF